MKRFETKQQESLKSKLTRFRFNIFPAIRGTGMWVSFIADSWSEIHVSLPLSWRTKNYVGTVFGGSIYGASDPFYMLQFMKLLGDDYIVWDQSAQIKFKKPVRKTVFANFIISDEILDHVKKEISLKNKMTIDLQVDFVDQEGVVYAEVIKTIYIADKKYYKSKNK